MVDDWPLSDSPVLTKYAFQIIIKYPPGFICSQARKQYESFIKYGTTKSFSNYHKLEEWYKICGIKEKVEVVDEILVEEPKMYKPAKVTSSADFKFKFSMPMKISEKLLNIPFEEL